MTRIAINGLGRIGRTFLKLALEHPALEVVVANDIADLISLAYLLKYDSVMGTLPNTIKASAGGISVDGDELQVLSERNPADLPWRDLGVDVEVLAAVDGHPVAVRQGNVLVIS